MSCEWSSDCAYREGLLVTKALVSSAPPSGLTLFFLGGRPTQLSWGTASGISDSMCVISALCSVSMCDTPNLPFPCYIHIVFYPNISLFFRFYVRKENLAGGGRFAV